MSTKGITLTILATQMAEAVKKDEEEGFDIGAGLFGENLSNWLREVAEQVASITDENIKLRQDLKDWEEECLV